MRLRDIERPVINRGWSQSLAHQRMTVLGTALLDTWAKVADAVPATQKGTVNYLAWLLEALLQVTSQRVPAEFSPATLDAYELRFKQLLGALYSKHFYFGSHTSRNRLATTLMTVRKRLSVQLGAPLTWHLPLDTRRVSPDIQQLASLADALEVDAAKVSQWQGWVCNKKADSQRLTFLPITPILERLGEPFAMKLYALCITYSSTRRCSELHAVRAMAEHLATAIEPVSADLLQDPEHSNEFFYSLYESYLRNGYRDGEGRAVAGLVTHWRGQVTAFFEDFVFPSGLIARPPSGLPTPRHINTGGEPTNVVDTESGLVHDKLLTPVPLESSDDEALEIIFERVEADLERAKRWAWHEVHRLAALLDRRKRLAKEGTVRQVGPYGSNSVVTGPTNWDHPDHLKNAAATFEALGYPCYGSGTDLSAVLFPKPRRRWTEELAVPTSSSLIAHCAVIVGEHPSVTPAFLEQLALYDVNGKLAGAVGTDSGVILSGAKLRRGPAHASQDIVLNERSAFAVDQIRLLTEPLRNFLRERGDGAWRYLLLTSSGGFGYPKRLDRLSTRTSAPDSLKALAKSFAQVLSMSPQEATGFASRFSLPAMRASAAVLVYFKSKSVHEMAKALGHTKYDIKLLERYLPKVLRQFFEERWIRIFQTGVIVQALEGSRFRLEASGFRTIEELDRFLLKHSIKLPKNQDANGSGGQHDPWSVGSLASPREAIFGLNEEILTTLISLDLAQGDGQQLAPRARYWAEVGRELIPYVEVSGKSRPDIQQYLERARAKATPHLVAKIAYAK